MRPTDLNTTLELALNLIGIFVFAISGALLAVRKNYDIVGMTVLAVITAIGGGMLRDVLLGALPPAVFSDPFALSIPIGATVIVFFAHARVNRIHAAMLVFDAAGLGLFCVAGAAKALAYGAGPLEAIALGAITAVGGGIMRDVLANEQPAVLRADSELYAVPAVLGAAIVVLLSYFHLYGAVGATCAALVVFALRIIALRYRIRAPRPRQTLPQRR